MDGDIGINVPHSSYEKSNCHLHFGTHPFITLSKHNNVHRHNFTNMNPILRSVSILSGICHLYYFWGDYRLLLTFFFTFL